MKRKTKQAAAKPAPPPIPASSPLDGFLPFEKYRRSRAAVFPTEHSGRWFITENRAELLDADALRQHRGRLFLHAERTDQVVDKVAKNAAEQRFRGGPDIREHTRETRGS